MKTILSLVAVGLCVVACSAVNAASLSLGTNNTAISLYLDGGAENGQFDTIFVSLKPNGSATFANQNSGAAAGVPRPAGEAFSYPNRMLTADPLDFPGGLALSQVGLVNTPQELSFAVGKAGGTLTTADQPGGKLFLANVDFPAIAQGAKGTATVQLISAGNLVVELNRAIPEPTTLGLAGLSLLGLVAARRRMA
ncbi:MAG: PEP-CTERM sorting domain-containing protein [Pirellulales bacterium]|nr:PEP-CTERM sorting domain-containing protein [Pirellulales bacterium]